MECNIMHWCEAIQGSRINFWSWSSPSSDPKQIAHSKNLTVLITLYFWHFLMHNGGMQHSKVSYNCVIIKSSVVLLWSPQPPSVPVSPAICWLQISETTFLPFRTLKELSKERSQKLSPNQKCPSVWRKLAKTNRKSGPFLRGEWFRRNFLFKCIPLCQVEVRSSTPGHIFMFRNTWVLAAPFDNCTQPKGSEISRYQADAEHLVYKSNK